MTNSQLITIQPLEHEELEAIEGELASGKFLSQKDRLTYLDALEFTAITRTQRIWREITLAARSLYLIREYGLFQDRENELGLPIQTWEEYIQYAERQGLARSTTFKHLASLRIANRGLGMSLEECMNVQGGVQTLHHLKDLAEYDQATGEIRGPKHPILLENLPHPEEKNYARRLRLVIEEIPEVLSPKGIRTLLRNDWGGEPQINFFPTLGPFGWSLGWYYSPDQIQQFRGIVGFGDMPQTVMHELVKLVRATEKEPERMETDTRCPHCSQKI